MSQGSSILMMTNKEEIVATSSVVFWRMSYIMNCNKTVYVLVYRLYFMNPFAPVPKFWLVNFLFPHFYLVKILAWTDNCKVIESNILQLVYSIIIKLDFPFPQLWILCPLLFIH